MSAPDIIHFSKILGTPGEVYERLIEEFFYPMCLVDPQVLRLRPCGGRWHGHYEELDGDFIPCDSYDQLVEFARKHRSFRSMHKFESSGSCIYFAVVDVDESGFSLIATIDTNLIAREYGWLEPGQWFKKVLTTVTAALRAEICRYGIEHEDYYVALSPTEILTQLRSGELLKLGDPIYHAISTELIGWREIDKLMARREVRFETRDLKYEESDSGYHLLYILPGSVTTSG